MELDHRGRLFELVRRLLSGDLDVAAFRKEFYFYYLDDVPDDALNEQEADFFSAIHEKLDWTDEFPDEQSRKAGWINHRELIDWLKQAKEKP